MATTLKLQNTVNWALPFLKNQPVDFNNMEPALTTGNMVLQTIFGAPFKWRFNRASFSFTAIPASASGVTPAVNAQSDYLLSLPNFGFLEDQVVTIGAGASQKLYEMGSKFSLARPTGIASRPTLLAAQLDDSEGNVTLRLNTMHDQAYTIEGEYQMQCPGLGSLASTLGPFPDDFVFVFNWGFLTIISMLVNDPRSAIWEKYFIGRLLGLQDGLDQVDIDIFLGLWQTNTKTAMRMQSAAQAGAAGRNQ